jgi:hypothetical protein
MPVHYFGVFEFESVFEFNCLIVFRKRKTISFNSPPLLLISGRFVFEPKSRQVRRCSLHSSAQCVVAPIAFQRIPASAAQRGLATAACSAGIARCSAEADGRALPVISYLRSDPSPSLAQGRAPPRVDPHAEGPWPI